MRLFFYFLPVLIPFSVWMYIMERSVGKDNFDYGMKQFFREWKFRHPEPEDMQRSLEGAIGLGLREVFALLKQRTRI